MVPGWFDVCFGYYLLASFGSGGVWEGWCNGVLGKVMILLCCAGDGILGNWWRGIHFLDGCMGMLFFLLRVTRLVDWVFVHIFFSLAYTSDVVGLFWGHDVALGLACLSGITFLSLGPLWG